MDPQIIKPDVPVETSGNNDHYEAPPSQKVSTAHTYILGLFIAHVLTIYIPWVLYGLILLAVSYGNEDAQWYTLVVILPMLAGLLVIVMTIFSVPFILASKRLIGRDRVIAWWLVGSTTVLILVWCIINIFSL